MSQNKNDTAWTALFKQYNILDIIEAEGRFRIAANLINKFREARLMTKFDHEINLPQIFRENNLSILPDTRGTYVIGHFNAYHKFPSVSPSTITDIPFPESIATIDYKNLYSESAALLCAYNSGIISTLLEEDVRFTVLGRMSTSQFGFRIKSNLSDRTHDISITNAQCEIDGGFEGETKFAIIEAKNYQADDFLIRQLYYPYRLWVQKTSKKVIPVFMTYSNDVFTFHVYEFRQQDDYNSILLSKQQSFQIAPERIELSDIIRVYESVTLVSDPIGIPFPQADKFSRVIDLLGLLYSSDLTQQEITTQYQFNRRQTNYYADSARYLGLVEKKGTKSTGISYSLTELGKNILEKTPKQKSLEIVDLILSHEVFYRALGRYLDTSERPSKDDVVLLMNDAKLDIGDGSTMPRRAQSVLAWVDWILQLQR